MGEREQGGMLRTVVVVGLVALIAAVIIYAVIGLSGHMKSTTNSASDGIQKEIKNVNGGVEEVTDDYDTSNYFYSDPESNNMVTITGMTTAARTALSGTVVVPSYMQKNGKKYTVNKIDSYVYSSSKITGVVIPNTIESIGDNAFAYSKLTSVSIGKNVETIENSAFQNTALTSVVIPDSVKTIGSKAFSDISANKDGFASIGKNTSYNKDTWDSSFGSHWDSNTGNRVGYKPTIISY